MNPLEKFRPRTLAQFGDGLHVSAAVGWAKGVLAGRPSKPFLVLFGPPGNGKSTLVWCMARDLGWEMADTNASQDRSSSSLRSATNAAMNGTPVFLDEADQISAKDQRLIAKLAPQFQAPVILACNDVGSIERDILDLALQVEVPKPSKQKIKDVGKLVGASSRSILAASSFRDLVHDSHDLVVGEMNESDVLASLLRGDSEAGKTSELMRAEPWILDNTEELEALSYDLWRSRYREVGSSMEKHLRRAASSPRLQSIRFPWSLALRGRFKREREAKEQAEKSKAKENQEKAPEVDLSVLKQAQERASRHVADISEWM